MAAEFKQTQQAWETRQQAMVHAARAPEIGCGCFFMIAETLRAR